MNYGCHHKYSKCCVLEWKAWNVKQQSRMGLVNHQFKVSKQHSLDHFMMCIYIFFFLIYFFFTFLLCQTRASFIKPSVYLAAILAFQTNFDDTTVGAHTLACHFMKRVLIERLFELFHQCFCFILGSIACACSKESLFYIKGNWAKVSLLSGVIHAHSCTVLACQ